MDAADVSERNEHMKAENNIDLTGFQGEVSDVQVVEPPQAADGLFSVKPNADMDLVAMARWCLRALRKNPRPNLDYECRFSMLPSWYPPCPGPNDHDPITIGDTDNRMDGAFGLASGCWDTCGTMGTAG
jgi:hypothetical protein